MSLLKILFSLCLLSLNAAVQASPSFKPFSAQYDVLHDGERVAVTTLTLTRGDEDVWQYSSKSEAVGWVSFLFDGKITEQSIFNWDNGMRILSYRYDRSGKEKHIKLKFDWQKMKVTNDINGDPWEMDLSPGTLDKLSINLALAERLSSGQTSISLPVADGGRLKTYDFNKVGEERVDTPMGKIKAIKISRNKRGRTGRQTWLWLAPELNNIIIKLEKHDDDDGLLSMMITSLKQK